MAQLYIRPAGGTLKVKLRSHLRTNALRGEVPVLSLGGLIFVWWSNQKIERGRQQQADVRKV
ncbi:UNVERIFIED_ORG: hypothetical protein J2W19_001096 [Shinella zoogloeoides]|nr:hypothetical protein [Shinella zoogloeoides]